MLEQSKTGMKIKIILNLQACTHTFLNMSALVKISVSNNKKPGFQKPTFASNPKVKAFTKSAPFCRALAFFVSGLV